MDKLSYALGLGIGTQLAQLGAQHLNLDDFKQAVSDMIDGKEPQISHEEARKLVKNLFQKQGKEQSRKAQLNGHQQGKIAEEPFFRQQHAPQAAGDDLDSTRQGESVAVQVPDYP